MQIADIINKVGQINLPSLKTVFIVGGAVVFIVMSWICFRWFRWKMRSEADGPFK